MFFGYSVRSPHRTTKPSRGGDPQAGLRRIPQFPPQEVSVKKVITKKLFLVRGCDGQTGAGSPPRRGGRLGLAGRGWRRLRRRERGWVIYRRRRVGSLLLLFIVRPLALATRHTRRGTGIYKRRRGRGSRRSHNTIARAGNSRALFESVASRLNAGRRSALRLNSGLVGGCG